MKKYVQLTFVLLLIAFPCEIKAQPGIPNSHAINAYRMSNFKKGNGYNSFEQTCYNFFYINKEKDTIQDKIILEIIVMHDKSLVRCNALQKYVILDSNRIFHPKLGPDEMDEFHFNYDETDYKFIALPKNEEPNSKLSFYRVFIDGRMLMLKSYGSKINTPNNNVNQYSLFGKSDGTLKSYSAWDENNLIYIEGKGLKVWKKRFFKNELANYISDCPELVSKLGTDGYNLENIIRIVMEYNELTEKKESL